MDKKYKMSNKNKEITHLKSLEIKGLWNEIDIKWNLDSKVNILIGKNGMGKTTLLKSIIAIINEDNEFYKNKFNYLSLLFNNKRYIEVQKNTDVNNRNEKINNVDKSYLIKENILSKQEFEGTRIFSKYIKIENIDTFDLSTENLKNISIIKNPEIKTGLDIILYELINSFKSYQLKLRNLEKKSNTLLNSKILEISLEDSENKSSIKEIQNNLKELRLLILNKDKKIKEIYQQQNNFIRIVNNLFSDTEKQLDFNESNSIIFRKNNKTILPNQLSSGEKQLLIILLTVIQQEKKPSIILMDEPELSLHLSWQIELINSIQILNPNSQLILATHSPSIFMNGWNDKITRIEDIISVSIPL